MGRFSHADWQSLCQVIREVHAHTELHTLPQLMVSLQRKLVACEMSSYQEVDIARKESIWVSDPEVQSAQKIASEYISQIGDFPVHTDFLRSGDGRARKVSDFLTQRQFAATGLEQECFRQLGMRGHLAYYVSEPDPEFQISLWVHRKQKDFSERDRMALDHLRPHFRQARNNVAALAALRQQLCQLTDGPNDQGIVILGQNGRALWMNELAGEWIERHFAHEPRGAYALPNSLVRWLEHSQRVNRALTCKPLQVRTGERRLEIKWLPGDNQNQFLILAESAKQRPARAMAEPALTERETEVLKWVVEGKSNPEIGVILGTSPNTVRKHVEHILAKLRVETRAAAVRTIWETRAG